jgi:hypothetical protein
VSLVPLESPSRTLLHVHNERRAGGELVHDLARCFPEFHHVAICVNPDPEDAGWLRAVSDSMRVLHAPKVTPEILNSLSPRIVVLHDTKGENLGTGDHEADWPYPWLREGRYAISLHSKVAHPLVPADIDVFTNQNVLDCYQELVTNMSSYGVLNVPAAKGERRDEAIKADFYPCLMRGVLEAP